MQLRTVRVTIAPGKTGDYWAWARDIVALWDAHGIKRAGGPYALKGPAGEDVALWLTVHDDESEIRGEFQAMYAGGRGKELIELRPPLVSETTSSLSEDWNPADGSGPPTAPAW
jgi:hypothetical protein